VAATLSFFCDAGFANQFYIFDFRMLEGRILHKKRVFGACGGGTLNWIFDGSYDGNQGARPAHPA
jgi:hypothetical protein